MPVCARLALFCARVQVRASVCFFERLTVFGCAGCPVGHPQPERMEVYGECEFVAEPEGSGWI